MFKSCVTEANDCCKSNLRTFKSKSVCLLYHQGAAGDTWCSTYHYTVVNMPSADALKSEGRRWGEGEAWGHEDQLNSDCTAGRGTKNKSKPPFASAQAWESVRYQTDSVCLRSQVPSMFTPSLCYLHDCGMVTFVSPQEKSTQPD